MKIVKSCQRVELLIERFRVVKIVSSLYRWILLVGTVRITIIYYIPSITLVKGFLQHEK